MRSGIPEAGHALCNFIASPSARRSLPQVTLVRSTVVVTSRSRSTLNRRGQALSEYAMLVAIVGMGLVVILGLFGRATRQVWQSNERKFADDPTVASGAPSPAPSPSPSGGGAASGSVQPTPPPASNPPPPPKQESGDSGSASTDSPGTTPDNPIGVGPAPGQEPSPSAP